MQIPPGISGDCADALVELCFVCMPAADADELTRFVEAVLWIAEREVLRAVADERQRWAESVNRREPN